MDDLDVVVPDAIDPVVGWKAVAVGPPSTAFAAAFASVMGLAQMDQRALTLRSPAYAVTWPPGEPLESVCLSADRYSLAWVKTETEFDADLSHSLYSNLDMQSTKHLNEVGPYPGYGWKLAQHIPVPDHGSPANECSCGIHIAATKSMALDYTGSGWVVEALVEVYGWGRTIKGTRGWRCQYVYPKKITLISAGGDTEIQLLKGIAERLASSYGVPVDISPRQKIMKDAKAELSLLDRISKPAKYTGVPRARLFAVIFALSTAVLALGTMTVLLNIRNRSGWEVVLDAATVAFGVFAGLKAARLTASAWRSR